MIFTLGAPVVTLDDPAQFPQSVNTKLIQAKDLSSSGITHVESFEVQDDKYTYTFKDMSKSDYEALLNFFLDDAEGMLNEFSLTDDLSVTRTVRFTHPQLNFRNTAFELWAGSFTVERIA